MAKNTTKGGWYGDSKRHSEVAQKSAKHRKKRIKGKPKVTSEMHKLYAVRDNKTGEFQGWSMHKKKQKV